MLYIHKMANVYISLHMKCVKLRSNKQSTYIAFNIHFQYKNINVKKGEISKDHAKTFLNDR